MTQEEKAEAYDKAIERAKSKIKNDKDHVLYEYDILDIFPELKESEHERFIIGDIISNGNVEYRVDNIVKNCIGQDCYFLVNVESEKDGTRYLKLSDSNGKTHNMGEITWLCEQVDAKFHKLKNN